jgi:hypothetical protein
MSVALQQLLHHAPFSTTNGEYGGGVAYTPDPSEFASTAFAATQQATTHPYAHDFGDDQSIGRELQQYDATSLQQQQTQQYESNQLQYQPAPPRQLMAYAPAQPRSSNRTPQPAEYLNTTSDHQQQAVRPTSGAPSSGGRGRGARLAAMQHDSPSHTQALHTPAGYGVEVAYPENHPSDTTVAPTYNTAHGMNLYNPNEISWAGDSVPPPDTLGLQAATSHEGEQQYPVRPSSRTGMASPMQQQHAPYSTQQLHPQHLAPVQQRSRPSSRNGRPIEQNLQQQQQQHLATTYAGHGYSQLAPTGTEFETVFSTGGRSDPTIAPTYSAQHGMHLYTPNEVSWANNITPLGQQGLQVAGAGDRSAEIPSPLGFQPQHGVGHQQELHQQQYPQREQQQLLQHQLDQAPPSTSAPIPRSQVYIDEHGNRVRFVPEYTHDTAFITAGLPPVQINPVIGLPHPVPSHAHGMNLFIPSEISYANNVVPNGVPGHFDRGFRQPVDLTHSQISYSHSQPLRPASRAASPASAASARPSSTRGQRIQVAFEVKPLDLAVNQAEEGVQQQGGSSSARPASGARRNSADRPQNLTSPMSAPYATSGSQTARTSPAPLLRVPTVVRANAAALRGLSSPGTPVRAAHSPMKVVHSGDALEIAHAENRPSDTSVTPTYHADHMMNLYDPNTVSWAGGVPPADRTGLRSPGPVKAFASTSPIEVRNGSRPTTANRSMTDSSSIPGGPIVPDSPPVRQPAPGASTDHPSTPSPRPPRFSRQPSGEVPRTLPAHHATSHPSGEWNFVQQLKRDDAQGLEGQERLRTPSTDAGCAGGRVSTPNAPPSRSGRALAPLVPAVLRSGGGAAAGVAAGGGAGGSAAVEMDGFVAVSKRKSPRVEKAQAHLANDSGSSDSAPPQRLSPHPPTSAQPHPSADAADAPRKYPKAVRMDF